MGFALTPRVGRGRSVVGILLIVAASLWLLLGAWMLFLVLVLTGTGGAGLVLSSPWTLAPLALVLGALALGVRLVAGEHETVRLGDQATDRAGAGASHHVDVANRRAPRRSAAWVVAVVAGLIAGFAVLDWVLSTRGEGPFPFAEVPKGDLLAYAAEDGIRLVRADGGRSWRIPGTDTMSDPAWAPDGERLAAMDLFTSGKVHTFALDGSKRTRLPVDADVVPDWSADGRWLVFSGGGEIPRIVIRPVQHPGRVVVLPMPGDDPEWSPDGRLIAFESRGRGDLLRIYVVRRDGTGLRALTKAAGGETGASQATWSPDGRRIAFTADFDGDSDIYIVRADGTALRQVTHNSVEDITPTWSPDGRRIAFGRNATEDEPSWIVVTDLATGTEAEIVEREIAYEPAWQPAAD